MDDGTKTINELVDIFYDNIKKYKLFSSEDKIPMLLEFNTIPNFKIDCDNKCHRKLYYKNKYYGEISFYGSHNTVIGENESDITPLSFKDWLTIDCVDDRDAIIIVLERIILKYFV